MHNHHSQACKLSNASLISSGIVKRRLLMDCSDGGQYCRVKDVQIHAFLTDENKSLYILGQPRGACRKSTFLSDAIFSIKVPAQKPPHCSQHAGHCTSRRALHTSLCICRPHNEIPAGIDDDAMARPLEQNHHLPSPCHHILHSQRCTVRFHSTSRRAPLIFWQHFRISLCDGHF